MGGYDHEKHDQELLTAARRIRRHVNQARPSAMSVSLFGIRNTDTGIAYAGYAFVRGGGEDPAHFVLTTDDHEWAVLKPGQSGMHGVGSYQDLARQLRRGEINTDQHDAAVNKLNEEAAKGDLFAWSGMREPSIAAYGDEDAWMREEGESPERVAEWLLAITEPGAIEAWCSGDEGEPVAEWEERLQAASPTLHRLMLENRGRLHAEMAAAKSGDEGARTDLLRQGWIVGA